MRLVRSIFGRYRDPKNGIESVPLVTEFPDDVFDATGDDESVEEKRGFMLAVGAGLAEIEAGREVSLSDVRAKLRLV